MLPSVMVLVAQLVGTCLVSCGLLRAGDYGAGKMEIKLALEAAMECITLTIFIITYDGGGGGG